MRSLYLLAAFLSAVCAQVVAGTFGNAVCEADYNSGIQALANCGYTISLDGSVAVTGARSTVSPCICKPVSHDHPNFSVQPVHSCTVLLHNAGQCQCNESNQDIRMCCPRQRPPNHPAHRTKYNGCVNRRFTNL
ncbi:hypothetical protein BJ741DRAFT_609730 [Chytriomyces cf. hyalinus JEL632]|nr:hypothetical protein BJ741DRAFT_609730 [Chytriomyces cf. hyalinus JEL632]